MRLNYVFDKLCIYQAFLEQYVLHLICHTLNKEDQQLFDGQTRHVQFSEHE